MDIKTLEKRIYKMYTPDCCVKRSIQRIEEASPNAFTSYSIAKEKDWNMNYLNKLHNLFLCGAHSKEMLLHIAEVSRHVHKKRVIIEVSAAMALVATIGVIVVCCSGR